ncbi:MAG: hypothetical protein HOD92_05215 [Deltaproteobacteria bacterium]|jgi:chorismate mutase / prephenate dehydratase|nr:hypothetical protein [Deltaproteobacteria bacterium]MBT4526997.1 hypothetical protein [Deltaproteobacteria bacterium]
MILDLSNYQRICTLGPKGTFSYQAANSIGGDSINEIQYTTTIPQIAHEVENAENILGVMPIENSTSGIVGPAQDSLVDSNLIISYELLIDVRYSLVSNVPLSEIKQLFCHAMAFNQNGLFTSQHLPAANVVFSNSNIHSAEEFKERSDEPVAAIIPLPAAHSDVYLKAKIMSDDTQDYKQNMTRFLVLEKNPKNYLPDFTRKKTAMYVLFDEDRHSLLFELLREFHVFNINLCRLESRPQKNKPWHYCFFIDFFNNHRVETCLAALDELNIQYKIFGSYDILEENIKSAKILT